MLDPLEMFRIELHCLGESNSYLVYILFQGQRVVTYGELTAFKRQVLGDDSANSQID